MLIEPQPQSGWARLSLSASSSLSASTVAWRQLRAEGLYLASNPNSSFFYVLTAMHAVHVLGGLAGLVRLIYLLRQPVFSLAAQHDGCDLVLLALHGGAMAVRLAGDVDQAVANSAGGLCERSEFAHRSARARIHGSFPLCHSF